DHTEGDEGKASTDMSPAATRAEAVTGAMTRMASPMDAAVTMTGSEVACRSPAATAPRRPTVCAYRAAGAPRTISYANRNSGILATANGLRVRAPRSYSTPLDTKKTGIKNP